MPLRIGISACLWHQDATRSICNGRPLVYIARSMLDYVAQPGVYASMIPPESPQGLSISEIVDQFDGILFHGGVDMSPTSYGEVPLRPEWKGDALRDAYELELFRNAFAKKLPILGICRGAQLVNVARGGSLYQDIQHMNPTALLHRDEVRYEKNRHTVRIVPQSGLSRLYPGVEHHQVNSVHHQGICRLGAGLMVEAYSIEDGIVEAVRYVAPEAEQYCFAVQWHPELQTEADTELLPANAILTEFLSACAERKSL